jgi:hypothetical protein
MRFLELEATFAGCVGECFNFAVETGSAAVKNDRGYTGGFRLGSESCTKRFGSGEICGELLLAQLWIERAEEHQRCASVIIDCLRVDVLRRESYGEAGTKSSASDFLADPPTALLEEIGFANGIHGIVPEERD